MLFRSELPYCHIDKIDFNYQVIVIPDSIQSFDIGKLFTCTSIKEKEGIIYTVIDNIAINFVKTREDEWFYTFYYYCWNVLHVLVDILAYKSFNLKYTRKGFKYTYGEKIIDISSNLKDIFEFFDLRFHMVNNGFPTEYTIYEFIQASPYYDSEYFTMKDFEEFDINFKLNKQYYENFLQYKLETTGEKKSFDEQIVLIDAYFMKANFLEKLSRIQLKKEFPGLKDKDIVIKPNVKSIEDLKAEKAEQIKNRKKINLKKIVNNKDDDDFKFDIN